MRLCMRSPLFLILFTIFSVLYFGVTAIAQTEQPLSPAQAALEEAKAEKLDAEQKKDEAQTTLDAATDALNTAIQKVADAEIAAKNEEGEIEIARQAVKDAEGELTTAESELASARKAVEDAQSKIFGSKEKLRGAKAKLNQLIGGTRPPLDIDIDKVVFETISPNILGENCDAEVSRGDRGEEIVDNNVYSSWTCNGYAELNFNLENRQAIKAIRVYTHNSSSRITGGPNDFDKPIDHPTGLNSYEVWVDDKSVFYGYPNVDENCSGPDTSAGGPVKQIPFPCVVIEFDAVAGQRVSIFTDDGRRNKDEQQQQIKAYQITKVAEVTMETGKLP